MMITIHLGPSETCHPQPFAWVTQLATTLATTYALASFCANLQPFLTPLVKLRGLNLLTAAVTDKANTLTAQMSESGLALAFLANVRRLSTNETAHLQASGLGHLLAISGGQVAVMLSPLMGIIGLGILFLCHISPQTERILSIARLFRALVRIVVTVMMALSFGFTGALARVVFLSEVRRNEAIQRLSLLLFTFGSIISTRHFLRLLVLLLLFVCAGNPFTNPSFLLSSLGAAIAGLGSRAAFLCLQTGQHPLPKSLFAIEHAVLSSLLTSVGVGLILLPFQNQSLFSAVIANIIALPLVNLVITPISLLLLILPMQWQVTTHATEILDLALAIFSAVATAFSSGENTNRSVLLFSETGKTTLLVILINLWFIEDMLATKTVRDFRQALKSQRS